MLLDYRVRLAQAPALALVLAFELAVVLALAARGFEFLTFRAGLGSTTTSSHHSRFLPIFTDFSDFLGRLRPRQTRLQKPPNALGVEESSSPRRVLHC